MISRSLYFPLQTAIQAILLSDGLTSFASFTYINPSAVLAAMSRVVGFDAGDVIRSDVILNLGMSSAVMFSVAEQNIFRIDGRVHECTQNFKHQ